MSLGSWRAILLALCLVSAIFNAISLFTGEIQASSALGFQVSRTSDNAVVHVDAVDPSGAAAASGVRVGDLIDVANLDPGDRYRLLTGVYPHERLSFSVVRDGSTVPIAYVAGGRPTWRWDTLLYSFASFWMLAFAAFIGWRRADMPEARVLCILLAVYPLGSAMLPGAWIGPSPIVDVITATVGWTIVWGQVALLATYASLVALPMSRWRIGLTALAYASTVGVGVYFVARLLMAWNGSLAWVAQGVGPDWNSAYAVIPYALSLLCAWAAIAEARGAERSRLAWIVAPLVVFYLFETMVYIVPALPSAVQHGAVIVTAYQFANVGVFLAPLGMTYVLFNRRVLGVGFVLNRVAIFSGVSIVVVGAFMLVEWALGTWLQNTGRTASLVVGAAVALLLGFSIRFVHDRVERVLDNVFFRRRHEDEQAIRRFAREASFVTDPGELVRRTVDVLEKHADASFVRLALLNRDGSYGGVSENDPAVVSLRTWHRRLDLHGLETSFEGEFAYPMVSRGRLVGALLLGPKRSQESYAPDESDAIEELAHHVGGVLDVLGQ